ncbi:MAG: hypothetical protein HY720_21140 [Planctomycetes bacterium]|nr:hypothetical protein [Planctomycetota bacterium]
MKNRIVVVTIVVVSTIALLLLLWDRGYFRPFGESDGEARDSARGRAAPDGRGGGPGEGPGTGGGAAAPDDGPPGWRERDAAAREAGAEGPGTPLPPVEEPPRPVEEVARDPEAAGDREVLHNSIVVGLEELVAWAERIVVGRVAGSECRWNDDRTAVFTFYQIDVDQTLKGETDSTIEVRVVGGEIPEENVALSVSHQPRFDPGDEGIFFLDDEPTLWTGLAAGEQGFLAFDRRGPEATFLKDGFGRPIHGIGASNRFRIRDEDRGRVEAAQVLERIRRLVR